MPRENARRPASQVSARRPDGVTSVALAGRRRPEGRRKGRLTRCASRRLEELPATRRGESERERRLRVDRASGKGRGDTTDDARASERLERRLDSEKRARDKTSRDSEGDRCGRYEM